jgi:hypothetical protein
MNVLDTYGRFLVVPAIDYQEIEEKKYLVIDFSPTLVSDLFGDSLS